MKTKLIYFCSVFSILISLQSFSQTKFIRCVVHVLYTSENENLTDAEVLSIIQETNAGFSKNKTAKFSRTPDIFGSDWADCEIQLCLSQVDPNGNPTNGITHNITDTPVSVGGCPSDPIWDPSTYFNIYLAPMGYEPSFPNFVMGGYASSPTNQVMCPNSSSFNFVIIATNSIPFIPELLNHEAGHVFGLDHLDGDNLADTPKATANITPETGYATECSTDLQNENSTTLTEDGNHWNGIDPPNMVENFMGLTFACSFMYTIEQKNLMNQYINQYLSNWVMSECENSTGNNTNGLNESAFIINYSPNPVNDYLNLQLPQTEIKEIAVVDLSGKLIFKELDINKSEHNLTLEKLEAGFYIIQVKNSQNLTSLLKIKKQ